MDEMYLFRTGDFSYPQIPKSLIAEIIDFAEKFEIGGNIWHKFILYKLLCDENPYTLAAEKGCKSGTVFELAQIDLTKILRAYADGIKQDGAECLKNFCPSRVTRGNWASFAAKRLNLLEKEINDSLSPQNFFNSLTFDINVNGAGNISFYDAFRLKSDGSLEPISNTDNRGLSHIVGFERQKQAIYENTRRLIAGKSFNNVLLYGDAGTGKSSTVKALIPEFCGKKLKMIEIFKHQYSLIPSLMSEVGNRGMKFILYLDDLSFEDFETEYKYFKAVLEGGLGKKPDNTAVYATSNRMHLIKETAGDKNDIQYNGDLHSSETTQEKISLSSRFGLTLYYPAPDKNKYLEIVRALASSQGIPADEHLESEAIKWETEHNRRSGRTAEQFINSVKDKISDEN